MIKLIIALLMTVASLTSYAQSAPVIGTTRNGDVTLRQSATSFVLQFTDSNAIVSYPFRDTAALRKAIEDVINERMFRATAGDATVRNAGKNRTAITVPTGRLELTRAEYQELFDTAPSRSIDEVRQNVTTVADSTAARLIRDTVYVVQPPPVASTPGKKQKPVRFMWGFQLSYFTNDELKELSGHGGGVNLTFGVRIKKQFTAGLGGGVYATAVEDEDGEFVLATHYPVYVEFQYVGKWAVNPFINLQAGIIVSSIDEVMQENRNENTTFASVKAGVAFGRRSKFALFGGYSLINLADLSMGNKFLTAGIGFTF